MLKIKLLENELKRKNFFCFLHKHESYEISLKKYVISRIEEENKMRSHIRALILLFFLFLVDNLTFFEKPDIYIPSEMILIIIFFCCLLAIKSKN